MHDKNLILLGSVGSSFRKVEAFDVDPQIFKAGIAVSLGADGLPSIEKVGARRIGISLGRSLSKIESTSFCRKGEDVPLLVTLPKASATVTITSYANLVSGTPDSLEVAGVSFVAQAGAASPGSAVFQAATSNNATATSLAAQINAHPTASLLVKATADDAEVLIEAVQGGESGNDISIEYVDGDTNVGLTIDGAEEDKLAGGSIDFVEPGAPVYINDSTGMADDEAGSTVSNAVYASGVLTGRQEDGTLVPCVKVTMSGGL